MILIVTEKELQDKIIYDMLWCANFVIVQTKIGSMIYKSRSEEFSPPNLIDKETLDKILNKNHDMY